MSQQSRPPQTPQPGLLNMPSALTTQQQQQQKLRLQRIQMERERIRMRQEELLRQVMPEILLVCSRAFSSMHPNFYQVQLAVTLSRLTIVLGKGNKKANINRTFLFVCFSLK